MYHYRKSASLPPPRPPGYHLGMIIDGRLQHPKFWAIIVGLLIVIAAIIFGSR
jgi:hypothetical protein